MIPMIAQVTGSVVNIVLDIILIFGTGHIPTFGIRGAAIATVIGQWVAMVITLLAVMKKYSLRGTLKPEFCKQIYANGIVPLAWVFHFIGLNAVWWTFPVTEIIASTTGILIIMILHKQDSALRI